MIYNANISYVRMKNEMNMDRYNMLYNAPTMNGVPVYVNPLCVTNEWNQYRFPKSKKSRIRKKWSKQNKNYRMEKVERAYMADGKLFVSQKAFDILLSNNGGGV